MRLRVQNYNLRLDAHRLLEILGCILFAISITVIGAKTVRSLLIASDELSLALRLAIPVLAYIGADFISGLVHFLCDNFGSPQTPWLGPNLIRPFREHHDDPEAIVSHDFIEVNGNTCLAATPVLVFTYYFIPTDDSVFWLNATLFLLLLVLFLVLTNQFHKWAHQPAPPKLIARLQQTHLILAPKHHSQHHCPPHNSHYCITSGWMNALLSRIGFFEQIEKLINGIVKSGDAGEKS